MKKENEPLDFTEITKTSKQSGFLSEFASMIMHKQEVVAHSYCAGPNLIWFTYYFGW